MLFSTTTTLQDKKLVKYIDVVTGETILGANVIKDFFAGFTDFFGGRSNAYESTIEEARITAMKEMEEKARKLGANGIVGIDIDYETIGRQSSSMLMVAVSGTAVLYEEENV